MRILVPVVCLSVFCAACAANRTAELASGDYVEISNPDYTRCSTAPATIWVPKRYLDSGPSRGGELLKKATVEVVDGFRRSLKLEDEQAPQQ
ncbi:hypothetical protein [Geobacter sp. AOG2]|uniref:hypothetical protein n=1 Tax=Geobacter sp. AOG2 TaxID=1566347 RepID=UPI001CC6B2B6|nr:hypothetical protein [Geobacter sp. AOG2]GFE59552.1 hypothetical protein AOG2_01400 [Geobacter sp. AOG2]